MDFRNHSFLKDHIKSIMDFYAPNILDSTGGYFQNFKDDGTVFNGGQRHLVSSCRMVFNFCKAYQLFGDEEYLLRAEHGVNYIRQFHWDGSRKGFNWTLTDGHHADDKTNHCYGTAFVILCFSAALEVGIEGSQQDIDNAYELLASHFWDEQAELYADDATPDWSSISDYRGQNANMHCCEAFIAAYEATGHAKYLDRAYLIARTIVLTLAGKSNGLIWEHFSKDLSIDWDYNKNDPQNLYRPWGFQPGHQAEWAKLLLVLYGHRPEEWMTARASDLFDRAMASGWDKVNGGILYGISPDGTICDDNKYFWVQAESFAAAARLHAITGDEKYEQWYALIWEYAWQHLIDHRYGAWFRVLTNDNQKISDEKSIAGGKCDYHTIGACWDVLRIMSSAS